MFHNNLVLAYILLVGIPLLGLFSIMEAGRGMTPVPAVGGEWALELDKGTAGGTGCLGPLAGVPRPVLNISQFGSNVALSFNQTQKITLDGNLDGNHLTGTAIVPATGGCADGARMRLAAAVGGKPGQHSLDVHLSWEGCAACAPVAFRGVKQNLSRKPGE